MRSESRLSRVDTKPTSSGDAALGMPCAAAGNAKTTARAAQAAGRISDMGFPSKILPANFRHYRHFRRCF
jgi:hypothetical protein